MINFIKKLITVFPALIFLVIMNVLITSTTAGVVLMELITAGYDKQWACVMSIVTAVVVYVFMMYNHKIRNYIKKVDQKERLDD